MYKIPVVKALKLRSNVLDFGITHRDDDMPLNKNKEPKQNID